MTKDQIRAWRDGAQSLQEVLELLYEAEINASVSSFWDGGWSFQLGDNVNGYLSADHFEDLQEGAEWLLEEARQHYPGAGL